MVSNFDSRPLPSLQHVMASSSLAVPLPATQIMMPLSTNQCSQSTVLGKPLGQSGFSEPNLQCATTEEGEIPESDLDPDTRRRLLILQHGQDFRYPPPPPPPPPPSFPFIPPLQVPVPPVKQLASRLPLEEAVNPRQLNRPPTEFALQPQIVHFNRNHFSHPSFFSGMDISFPSDRVLHENERPPNEVRQFIV